MTHEDVAAVAYDTEHFTSRSVVVSELRPGENDLPGADRGRAADHLRPAVPRDGAAAAAARRSRRSRSPRSSRSRASSATSCSTRPRARRRSTPPSTTRSTSRCGSSCRCSASRRRTPTSSAASSASSSKTSTCRPRSGRRTINEGELDAYLDARIEEHLAEPARRPHVFLLEAELDGNKLHPDHVRGTMVLLMVAGIDTTWSAIGASLWHLAQHPDDRKRLAAEPDAHGHRGRGVPARVRAGHDGAARRPRTSTSTGAR